MSQFSDVNIVARGYMFDSTSNTLDQFKPEYGQQDHALVRAKSKEFVLLSWNLMNGCDTDSTKIKMDLAFPNLSESMKNEAVEMLRKYNTERGIKSLDIMEKESRLFQGMPVIYNLQGVSEDFKIYLERKYSKGNERLYHTIECSRTITYIHGKPTTINKSEYNVTILPNDFTFTDVNAQDVKICYGKNNMGHTTNLMLNFSFNGTDYVLFNVHVHFKTDERTLERFFSHPKMKDKNVIYLGNFNRKFPMNWFKRFNLTYLQPKGESFINKIGKGPVSTDIPDGIVFRL